MKKIFINDVLLEVEELKPVTKATISDYKLIKTENEVEIRQINDCKRFRYNTKTDKITYESLFLFDETAEWQQEGEELLL